MSQTKVQLIHPIGVTTFPSMNITGVVTSTAGFQGDFTGTATGLANNSCLNVGTICGTNFVGDGSNMSGVAKTPFTAQNVTAVSGTTTINLSSGNVITFTQNVNTTVAFANTDGNNQELRIIRKKNADENNRTITWPANVYWKGGTAPTLVGASISTTDAQIFNLITRDGGSTWMGYEQFCRNASYTASVWGHKNMAANYLAPKTYDWRTGGKPLNTQAGNYVTNTGCQPCAYSSPVQMSSDTNWRSIGRHAGTKLDGTLWGWGKNECGLLANPCIEKVTPSTMENIYWSSPVQVPGNNWYKVYPHLCTERIHAVRTDGTLWAWGGQNYGELGLNAQGNPRRSSPTQVGTAASFTSPKALLSNCEFVTMIKCDGTMWSWGYNVHGNLGINNATSMSVPVQIGTDTNWSKVAQTNYGALAVKTNGTLWSWGANAYGQLGLNDRGAGLALSRSVPVQIGSDTNWEDVYSNWNRSSMAKKTDGSFWAWGYGEFGIWGNNTCVTQTYSSPIQIHAAGVYSDFVNTSACVGYFRKCDGTLWASGSNCSGQLGCGSWPLCCCYSSPVQIGSDTNWTMDRNVSTMWTGPIAKDLNA